VKDLGSLMKQAQAMQEKLRDAQAKLAESEVDGSSGGGMVSLTLTGGGLLSRLSIDDALLKEGEGEIVADLIIAAHADARKKLEAKQNDVMRDVAGPFAGMPGMPTF
jgi:DNA-binding YbaB/EbfC family protein